MPAYDVKKTVKNCRTVSFFCNGHFFFQIPFFWWEVKSSVILPAKHAMYQTRLVKTRGGGAGFFTTPQNFFFPQSRKKEIKKHTPSPFFPSRNRKKLFGKERNLSPSSRNFAVWRGGERRKKPSPTSFPFPNNNDKIWFSVCILGRRREWASPPTSAAKRHASMGVWSPLSVSRSEEGKKENAFLITANRGKEKKECQNASLPSPACNCSSDRGPLLLPLFFPSLINVFLPPLGSLVRGRKFAHSRQEKRKIVLQYYQYCPPQLQMIIDQHTLLNPAPQKDQQRLCCLAFFFLLFLGGRFSSSSFFSRQMGPSHARGKGRETGGKEEAVLGIHFYWVPPPHRKYQQEYSGDTLSSKHLITFNTCHKKLCMRRS